MEILKQYKNCILHLGAAMVATKMQNDKILVKTDNANYIFDFLIFATGIRVDLKIRPEFPKLATMLPHGLTRLALIFLNKTTLWAYIRI